MGRRTEHYAVIPWSSEIFLIFINFQRSQLSSRSTALDATRLYSFITNNHASFYSWWKENLLKYRKVSKYYEHDCRSYQAAGSFPAPQLYWQSAVTSRGSTPHKIVYDPCQWIFSTQRRMQNPFKDLRRSFL